MADIEKEKETKKEEVPAWAQSLQETLDSLPNRLSEILKPQEKDPEPTPDPEPENTPKEIPVPEIPQPETPTPEPAEPEKETPKKKNFLDWLL